MKIRGKLVDIHKRDIYPAVITVSGGLIRLIERADLVPDVYLLPGLIDAHIHIESSMVTPGAFALAAVRHGTTAVVSDPHEIANVLGIEGVMFMIRDSEKVPVRFYFGAPSCVPATGFETSGSSISLKDLETLLGNDKITYLSEMMNFPGVVYDDKEVLSKIQIARKAGKPVDGHAPGLYGELLRKYVKAGISTDHECSSIAEAVEKIGLGMKILIREGSAARNLDSLKELYKTYPGMLMLCSDDLHPEMLEVRHINKLIARLVSEGYDVFDVIRSATINPSEHYGIVPGLLRAGDRADFVIADSLGEMNILETWIEGKKVFSNGKVFFKYNNEQAVNNFNCLPVDESMIRVKRDGGTIRVIEAFDGELVTGEIHCPSGVGEFVDSDPGEDILKIVVKDRYNDAPPATGFIKGFGLKEGAIASSIAHDSHNIIAVGTNDKDIVNVINEIVRLQGGIAVGTGAEIHSLRLDIGGIMSTRPCSEVADCYEKLNEQAKKRGCTLQAPFMTLSFMALLVIPDLKIGDKGLFDLKKFGLVPLFV